MDLLLPAIYEALNTDTELTNLATIDQFRHPEDPARLAKAAVVIRPADIGDEPGLHGAALTAEIEVSVWHYGQQNYKTAVQAATRVGDIFIAERLPLSSGGHTRWGEVLGWQQLDQPDPKTILLRAEFRARYWSQGRVDALTA